MNAKKTDLKCKGCGCAMPDIEYDIVSHRPLWFGRYENCKLVEIICTGCKDKGEIYSE